jgi:hypothetical protein
MEVEGVVVGGLMVAFALLMIWKRSATARLLVRLYRRHSDLYPVLYPGPLRRWTTSEDVWKVLIIPIAVVWGAGGLRFFIVGMGWG